MENKFWPSSFSCLLCHSHYPEVTAAINCCGGGQIGEYTLTRVSVPRIEAVKWRKPTKADQATPA